MRLRPVQMLLLVTALIAGHLSLVVPASAQLMQEQGPVTDAAPAIPPIVWQLVAFPGVGVVDEPGRYTAQFLPDGTLSLRADCNWVGGFWSGANGVLDITVSTSTLVGCPPDSLEQPFVQALDAATAYVVDGFTLVITTPSGDLQFTPEMPAMA
jgi:heat shock protein HslJ